MMLAKSIRQADRITGDLGVPAALENALGTNVGAQIDFLLAVTDPNKPVVVHAP
jgi:hypothetical protein